MLKKKSLIIFQLFNLSRARTNPPAKQLHTVIARDTGVDTTGCIILLQFCPRLTKGGGKLVHESVGDAIMTLNKKLKVSNIILKGNQKIERYEIFADF